MQRCKSFGFALLEVLIAVIVILGLTLWWVKSQAHQSDVQMAAKMTEQMNQILNAVVNYYENGSHDPSDQDAWPPKVSVQDLIDRKLLLDANLQNPFGQNYVLTADKDNNLEILTTTLPHDKSALAFKAIAPLANASLMDYKQGDNNPIKIVIKLPVPAEFSRDDPVAVKFMTTVPDGTFIPNNVVNCPNYVDYKRQIFTATQSCSGAYQQNQNNQAPIESCNTWAEPTVDPNNPDQPGWKIHMTVLTPMGWSNMATDSGADHNVVQVSVKCVKVH